VAKRPTAKRVQGAPYLYERDGSYYVRKQVPADLRIKVGKPELIEFIQGNLATAKRQSFGIVDKFNRIISDAREPEELVQIVTDDHIDDYMINKAIWDFNSRLVRLNRQRDGRLAYASEERRKLRLAEIREELAFWEAVQIADEEGLRTAETRWYCEELGWQLNENGLKFARLCDGLQRSAVEALREQVRHLSADRSPRQNADPLFVEQPMRSPKSDMTIGDMIARYRAENEVNWSPSTKMNYRIIFRVLEQICGTETPVKSIDREFCLNLRNALTRIPSNYSKMPPTRGKRLTEVLDIADRLQMPRIGVVSINKHLSQFRSLIKAPIKQGLIIGDPMDGLDLVDKIRPKDKRDPFSQSQLQVIFYAEPWAKGHPGQGNKPERYWVPLIGLFSGARLGEICGLKCSEIVSIGDAHLFEFRNREDRHIKTYNSRNVPIHSKLIELGLLNYVDRQNKAGEEFLFPNCVGSSEKRWGRNVSRWFSELVRNLELRGKLCFHSFRHSFEDRLREADLHETPLGGSLAGRSVGTTGGRYGQGNYSTAKHVEAMERVQYPDLCLDHLLPPK